MEEIMSEWKEFTAKTVDEALTNALVQLETTSDKVEYRKGKYRDTWAIQ